MNTYASLNRENEHPEELVRLLVDAQQREAQLEAAYTAGVATSEQLDELEHIRSRMDEYVARLDDLGYYTTS
jgi:hypothetical protein